MFGRFVSQPLPVRTCARLRMLVVGRAISDLSVSAGHIRPCGRNGLSSTQPHLLLVSPGCNTRHLAAKHSVRLITSVRGCLHNPSAAHALPGALLSSTALPPARWEHALDVSNRQQIELASMMFCGVDGASMPACAQPSGRADQQLVGLRQAPDRPRHTACSTAAVAPVQSVHELLQRAESNVGLRFYVQAFQHQLQPWQPQLAAAACGTQEAAAQYQKQSQHLLHDLPAPLPHHTPTQRHKQLLQRQQQHVPLQSRAQEQRAKFRDALRCCQTWEQLTTYLMTEQQQRTDAARQQQQPASHICLWQQLNSQQARVTLQHATQLASTQRRRQQQLDQCQLQTVLRGLVNTAAAGVACGDAVAAAQVLRASWKLLSQQDSSQQQLEQDQGLRQLQHQLLDSMCGTPPPSAAADTAATERVATGPTQPDFVSVAAGSAKPPVLKNANLLGDVSAAVLQLQLQPSRDWLNWYRGVSIDLLQPRPRQQQQQRDAAQQVVAVYGLQQQESAAVTSWFLVNAMQLAQYISRQQTAQPHQQNLFPADPVWHQAWCAAAAPLDHPFSPTQLILVTAAAAQLQMQLPCSFLQAHLQPDGLTQFKSHDLVRLLGYLAQLQQQHHQQQQQWQLPHSWLAAAAEAVPIAAAELAEADAAAARLLPGAVCAAAKLKLPLNQAGLEQLLEALLRQHQRWQQQQLFNPRAIAADTSVTVEPCDGSSSAAHSSSNGSGFKRRTSALQLVTAADACSAVVALAQISKHRLQYQPPIQLLQQLQQQLRRLLVKADVSDLIAVLWAFTVVWKAPVLKPVMALVLRVTQQRLRQCSANQLRLLGIALAATAPAELPAAWAKQYVACTAEILALQQARITSRNQRQPHQQEQWQHHQDLTPAEAAAHAAFLSNVSCCLAKLAIVPDQRWRFMWRQQVLLALRFMKSDQVVDVLYAAAVWATQPDSAPSELTVATAQAQSAQYSTPSQTQQQQMSDVDNSGVHSEPLHDATAAVAEEAAAPVLQSAQQLLLPRPVFRATSTTAAVAGSPEAVIHSNNTPPAAWVNAVLLQLRQQMPQCTPKQLTTALWCLNKLRFRAAVPWLDALYDGLLTQLPQCSLLQLQQLLRGLLHQGLQLAPARIDHVLEAALQHMQGGNSAITHSSSRGGVSLGAAHRSAAVGQIKSYACTEQQLVWLLQLVVQLKHDPDPDWGRAVAREAQHMLAQHASSPDSGNPSSAGWNAPLLTDLLDSFAQLGVQLPPKWISCYRRRVWRTGLRSFSGLQLARVLSSIAALHCSGGPRPFLRSILQRVMRQLHSMDPHAVGLVGVAVGQLGLVPARRWSLRYLQRVQQLMQSKVRVPVSDAANLQRSVQYTRWCIVHSNSRLGRQQVAGVKQPGSRQQRCLAALWRQQCRTCRSGATRQGQPSL